MKPGGVILTCMIWLRHGRSYIRWIGDIVFNVPLLAWQLTFLIVGTAYGKITIGEPLPSQSTWVYRWAVMPWSIILIIDGIYRVFTGQWLFAIVRLVTLVVLWIISGVSLRRVWRAATICHVRLCLRKSGITTPPPRSYYSWFISFTAPEVKLELWRPDQIRGRFSCLDPTFDVSDAEQGAMNAYAEKIVGNPVARKYDYLQLLSYAVNLPLWVAWPRCWGREVISWFNLPGGREVCSSGVTAILKYCIENPAGWESWDFWFYSTSTIPPCLFDIDKNWKREILVAGETLKPPK